MGMTEKYDVELYKTQRSETVHYYTTGSSILWHIVVMGGHIKPSIVTAGSAVHKQLLLWLKAFACIIGGLFLFH